MTDVAQGGPIGMHEPENGTILHPLNREGVNVSLDAVFPMTAKMRTVSFGPSTRRVLVHKRTEANDLPIQRPATSYDGPEDGDDFMESSEGGITPDAASDQEDTSGVGDEASSEEEEDRIADRIFFGPVMATDGHESDFMSPMPAHGEDAKPDLSWPSIPCDQGGSGIVSAGH